MNPTEIYIPSCHHILFIGGCKGPGAEFITLCMAHVAWCMPGSLTCGFLWSRRREKSFRHSRHLHSPQLYVSGKRHMGRSAVSVSSTTVRCPHGALRLTDYFPQEIIHKSSYAGPLFTDKTMFMITLRRSSDPLMFIMGISIPIKRGLFIE